MITQLRYDLHRLTTRKIKNLGHAMIQNFSSGRLLNMVWACLELQLKKASPIKLRWLYSVASITKWSWRVPNPMLQYTDIQFLEGLVSYFGHGLSTMLHDQSLSSFCHELSDNVKVRFSDFKRHFSDNCFLILPLWNCWIFQITVNQWNIISLKGWHAARVYIYRAACLTHGDTRVQMTQ